MGGSLAVPRMRVTLHSARKIRARDHGELNGIDTVCGIWWVARTGAGAPPGRRLRADEGHAEPPVTDCPAEGREGRVFENRLNSPSVDLMT
jgi:hypothetical protein